MHKQPAKIWKQGQKPRKFASMYLEPGMILRRHPEISRHWTAADIGYLLRLGLVDGRKQLRGCLVDEQQVVELHKKRCLKA